MANIKIQPVGGSDQWAEFPLAQGGDSWADYPIEGASGAKPPSTLESIHQTVSDATTGLGQGLTMGFMDEALAAAATPIELGIGAVSGTDSGKGIVERVGDAYGRSREKSLAQVKGAKERSPIAATVGEIAGGALTAGGLGKSGITLLRSANPTATSLIGRGAAEGAAYGAVHGAGTAEGGLQERGEGALKGGAVGLAAGGALGAVGAKTAANLAKRGVPTSDDLRRAANAAYREAESQGVVVSQNSYQVMVNRMFQRLANEGVDPTLHPGVMGAFKRLDELQSQPVSFKTLDIIRRVANSSGKSLANRDEGRLARIMVDEIDDLMNNLRPSDLISGASQGAGQKASEAIMRARDLWSRTRKSEAVENVIERAMDKVGANYTAAGYQTAIRQEIRSLLRNQSAIRGFNKAEIGMMRGIVRGASVENFLRHVGKLAPRGIVGATLGGGAGYALGGPVGSAAVWGVGEAAKRTSAAMTQKKLDNLVELIRRGGPRILNMLPPQQRAALDAAIASGAIAPEALGLDLIGTATRSISP